MNGKNLSRLPFTPEPIERLRDRWQSALHPIVDAEAIERRDPRAYYPSKHRRHCFDTETGFRFFVSQDRHRTRHVLHVSISFDDRLRGKHRDAESLMRAGIAELKEFGGLLVQNEPDAHRVTGEGIYHFCWEFNDAGNDLRGRKPHAGVHPAG